jgi:hypothetical protein
LYRKPRERFEFEGEPVQLVITLSFASSKIGQQKRFLPNSNLQSHDYFVISHVQTGHALLSSPKYEFPYVLNALILRQTPWCPAPHKKKQKTNSQCADKIAGSTGKASELFACTRSLAGTCLTTTRWRRSQTGGALKANDDEWGHSFPPPPAPSNKGICFCYQCIQSALKFRRRHGSMIFSTKFS